MTETSSQGNAWLIFMLPLKSTGWSTREAGVGTGREQGQEHFVLAARNTLIALKLVERDRQTNRAKRERERGGVKGVRGARGEKKRNGQRLREWRSHRKVPAYRHILHCLSNNVEWSQQALLELRLQPRLPSFLPLVSAPTTSP